MYQLELLGIFFFRKCKDGFGGEEGLDRHPLMLRKQCWHLEFFKKELVFIFKGEENVRQ